MSDLKQQGFASSEYIATLGSAFSELSDSDRKAEINKAKTVFELSIKNKEGKEQSWLIDLKKEGKIVKGKPEGAKPDVTLILDDETFVGLATGKLSGQKAYMTGKLKSKGNLMLATKLDGVLKIAQKKPKAKL